MLALLRGGNYIYFGIWVLVLLIFFNLVVEYCCEVSLSDGWPYIQPPVCNLNIQILSKKYNHNIDINCNILYGKNIP